MMRLVRRVLAALAAAGVIAAALRIRGRGGTPPQHGGWKQLDLPTDGQAQAPVDASDASDVSDVSAVSAVPE